MPFDLRAADVDADSHAPTIARNSSGQPATRPGSRRRSPCVAAEARPTLEGCGCLDSRRARAASSSRGAGGGRGGAAGAGADVHDAALRRSSPTATAPPATGVSASRRRSAGPRARRSRSGSRARIARCSSTRLMVTNMTAARGIGNRPGVWNFLSGPFFPYGKRRDGAADLGARARQALRHRRHAGRQARPGSGFTSRCRRASRTTAARSWPSEINVDAITCPTRFTSAKGKLDASTKSYYPPRNDLTTFGNGDCDVVGGAFPGCAVSAMTLRGAERSGRGRGGDAGLRRAVHRHLDDSGDASRRRLRAARRGEQGVRHQRRRTATRRTRIRSCRVRPHRTTSASRRSSTASRSTSTCAAGVAARGDRVADRRLQRLDRRGRRDHRARRDDLDGRSRLGRGAPARDPTAAGTGPGARQRASRAARPRCTPPPPPPGTGDRGAGRRRSALADTSAVVDVQERARRRWRRRQLRDSLPRGRHDDRSGVRGGGPRAPGRARRAGLGRDAHHHRAQARDRLRGRACARRTPAGRPRPSCAGRVRDARHAVQAGRGLLRRDRGLGIGDGLPGRGAAAGARPPAAGERDGRDGDRPLLPVGAPGGRGAAPQRHRPGRGPNVTFAGRGTAARRCIFRYNAAPDVEGA